MKCFRCFILQRSKITRIKKDHSSPSDEKNSSRSPETKKQKAASETSNREEINQVQNGNIAAQSFTFRELATATQNFHQGCVLGEGGFGRVYKGKLGSSGQVVAVKQLDRNRLQGNKEFFVEVLMLSVLHHENLVGLLGYCADGDQRLLVYEYMTGGSLEDHLLGVRRDQKPLDWFTRMKVAYGAAKGLEYLHDKANPPLIYRDLKPSNILLDEDFNPKLSDFGLAKLGSPKDKMHLSSRVMGTYGYCAPEYSSSGQLTLKSDVYSFGVVLLELITGRRAIDTTRPIEEQNLVAWAQSLSKDPKKFTDMADPLLEKQFPEKDLNQAVAIAAMCLQEEPTVRPLMSDVVTTLSFLSTTTAGNMPSPLPIPTTTLRCEIHQDNLDNDSSDAERHHDEDGSNNEGGINIEGEDVEAKERLSSSSHDSGKRSSPGGRASFSEKGCFRLHKANSMSSSCGSGEVTEKGSSRKSFRSITIAGDDGMQL